MSAKNMHTQNTRKAVLCHETYIRGHEMHSELAAQIVKKKLNATQPCMSEPD